MILNHPDSAPPLEAQRRLPSLRLVIGILLAGALIVSSIVFTLPVFTLNPGPTPNAVELVEISAPQTYRSKGSIHITTVRLNEANLLTVVRGLIDPTIDIVPRSAVYPPDVTREEFDAELAAQMDESQYSASISALRELGYALDADGALVRATLKGTPGAEFLKPGDVLVGIDGKPVTSPAELVKLLEGRAVGSEVKLSFRRDDATQDVTVKLAESPDPDKRAIIGVEVLQDFKLPFAINIDVKDIGGPSAGLMFAVAIVDVLDPDDLTGGKVIAGTGEIDADGNVRAIGGIDQKIEAAERIRARVFLTPYGELSQARQAADSNMRVIGVRSLRDAVAALREVS
jgi:PDZ domain-containing protein